MPVGDLWRRTTEFVSDHTLAVALAMVGILAHARVFMITLFGYSRPVMVADTAVFEYFGWRMTRGEALYVDLWEVKPPLPFETTAALSLLSGGNPYLHHVLSVLVMVGAGVGSMLVLARLCMFLTGDRRAALVGGLAPLLLPGVVHTAGFGFKPKPFVLLFGALALYLALTDRPFGAGAAAAATVGFWQLAAVYPLVALGIGYQRGGLGALGRTVAGGVALTAAMVAPVVLAGNVGPMLTEAVIVPLVVSNESSILWRVAKGGWFLGLAAPVVALAALGFWWMRPLSEHWWVVALTGWFGAIALFLDLDGPPDMIPGMVVVALGLAFLVANQSVVSDRVLVGAVCLGVAASVLLLGGVGFVLTDPYAIPRPEPLSALRAVQFDHGVAPDVRYLFWERADVATCHHRYSTLETKWIELTGGNYEATNCGSLREALAVL